MRTHSFLTLAVLVLAAGTAPGQQTLSFDSPTSPGPLPGAVNPEGWSSDGGTVTVVPHGPLSGPAGGFPAHGDQWCILNPGTTGGLGVPAGGPAPYPFAPGQTANVRVPLPIPPSAGQPVTLRFDWTYVSRESPNASSYNDFLTVDLTDGNGTVLQNLLYRDTHSTTLVSPPAVPPETGALPGSGYEEDPPGAPKTAVVTVDPALHGNAGVWLEIHVGNAGDSAVDSYAYVDHVRPNDAAALREAAEVPALVAADWCVDEARVYFTGHSDGGTTATILALNELGLQPAAIAPSAAGVSESNLATVDCRSTPLPVMVMHAEDDTLFPGFGAQAADWWAACNGCGPAGAARPDGCRPYDSCGAATLYCEGTGGHGAWPPLDDAVLTFFDAH